MVLASTSTFAKKQKTSSKKDIQNVISKTIENNVEGKLISFNTAAKSYEHFIEIGIYHILILMIIFVFKII